MNYNENMTMLELTKVYNKITGKNIKGFSTKAIALEKIKQAETLYSSKPYQPSIKDEPVKDQKKLSPKQLEDQLGLPAIVIRRKLRKLFPDMAKKGTWKITSEMIEALKK